MAAMPAIGDATAVPLEVIRAFARRTPAAGEVVGCCYFTGATAKQRKRGRRHFSRRAHDLGREIAALVAGVRFAFLYDIGSLSAHGAACLLREMRQATTAAGYADLAVLDLGTQGTTFFFVRRSLLAQRLRCMVAEHRKVEGVLPCCAPPFSTQYYCDYLFYRLSQSTV